MKSASIRKFRTGLSTYTKTGEMVMITNHGKMVGCFLPLAATGDIPIDFKREFVATLGKKIARQIAAKKLSEKEILDDFKKFKKNRRR